MFAEVSSMDDGKSATLIEHLEELRIRLLKCIILLALLFPAAWPLSQVSIEWMKRSLCPAQLEGLYYMAPMELFFLRIKVSAAMALFAAIPLIAWQAWAFVSPALFKGERRAVLLLTLSSAFFFVAGALFALFAIFPILMRYSVEMGSPEIRPMMNVSSFVEMSGLLMLGFGICFQLPIAVFILVRTGVAGVAAFKAARPYVIVGIFIAAGILTPPDVVSQIAMALPTWALFEISLFLAAWAEWRESKKGDDGDA